MQDREKLSQLTQWADLRQDLSLLRPMAFPKEFPVTAVETALNTMDGKLEGQTPGRCLLILKGPLGRRIVTEARKAVVVGNNDVHEGETLRSTLEAVTAATETVLEQSHFCVAPGGAETDPNAKLTTRSFDFGSGRRDGLQAA